MRGNYARHVRSMLVVVRTLAVVSLKKGKQFLPPLTWKWTRWRQILLGRCVASARRSSRRRSLYYYDYSDFCVYFAMELSPRTERDALVEEPLVVPLLRRESTHTHTHASFLSFSLAFPFRSFLSSCSWLIRLAG